MKILVTGGAGFIGSHFIKYMLAQTEFQIVNLDALTYAADLDSLEAVAGSERYTFIQGNINNRSLVQSIFREHNITIVVNFAAESHVDRSIVDPEIFTKTNVLGTQVLLDTALKSWSRKPDKYAPDLGGHHKFIQISTDEVYGSLQASEYFTEHTNLSPNSPYSASKAAADMLVRAYHQTYGLPVNITRCSNNYGPNQYPEKLIPFMFSRAMKGEKLPLYGDGLQIRDWLYVEDHCSAIAVVLEKGKDGEVYNIGGNNEKTNIEVALNILAHAGKEKEEICFVTDRPGHDRRYAIDSSKIQQELGWSPVYTFEKGIKLTLDWYQQHPEWFKKIAAAKSQIS
ncbi:dTDP-glucose 4,6-dehydratase [Jeotgalibacillus salarius]|uniref:dTDP-glucose 4,6-dehydratase n=1 Tax=Jeotgalibacillus salarius TaxID=546023 RepID=A0A4Y8LGX1_9BACL|nr:dTDP-glucose 4,6-dehydratase [Jeotgalibacillus salarius]TFE01700.1 dTDP-glucose 4,6-dehydratase [Jeotgalibacillus salarius]